MTKVFKYSFVFGSLFLLVLTPAISQVTITGPACVIPGTVYQYLISGPWDSTSTMQVCVTGGQLADSSGTCTPTGRPIPFVRVTWNAGSTGALQVQSSKGNSTTTVSISSSVAGGAVTDSTGNQQIVFLAIPSIINCSAATGGSCSPGYTYQWQLSLDKVAWSDIPNAIDQNLAISQGATQTFFVRRKVTDSSSNTVAYSNVATINVGPPAPTIESTN